MSCKVLLSLLMTFIGVETSKEDWCNKQFCRLLQTGTQTICANSDHQAKCFEKGDLGGGLSTADRDSIVDLHNHYREKVADGKENNGNPGPQPAAKPGTMPNLEWDRQLAALAQRWANRCDFGYDPCRDVYALQVGQSIGFRGTNQNPNTTDLLDIVKEWYSEVEFFNKTEVTRFKGSNRVDDQLTISAEVRGSIIGHYTQIVWANTTKIGCGVRNFFDKYYRRYLVCNYEPSGNIQGEPVYQT